MTALLWMALAPAVIDWPQWRGPARDAVSADAVRAQWPAKLARQWQVNVGEGHSSPIAVGGVVYQFSRSGGQEHLTAIDGKSGKTLWRQAYTAPYKMNSAATSHGEGPKSTPVFAGGRIYTLGISGILSCWEAASGKLAWRKQFSYSETSPLYGTAMSPIVDEGLLIAHVGGNSGGALTAFDAVTGAERWQWKEDGPGYASPVIGVFDGVRQVITESQEHVIGVDAKTGALLWKIPLSTAYTQNAVTPIVWGKTVIYSGLGKGVNAVRPVKTARGWVAEPIWNTTEVAMYMNSPVRVSNRLCGFSHQNKGQYFCLDLDSGKVAWKGEPRQGDNAAMVVAGEDVLMLGADGELRVGRLRGAAIEVMHRYAVADSPTWAHPVPFGDGVLVKDRTSLSLWR
ncbi:MAG: PQQ-binding-like beta-propeller repeat protein [Bryobacteraceae bacterium]